MEDKIANTGEVAKEIAYNSLALAEDRAKSMQRTVELRFKNQTDTLKILLNIVLVAVGGNLTIFTVNANSPGLIKTPIFLVFAFILLVTTGCFVFLALKKYSSHLESSSLKINARRVAVLIAVQNVLFDPANPIEHQKLSQALAPLQEVEVEAMPTRYERSDIYAAIAILISFFCTVLAVLPELFSLKCG